MYFTLQTPKPGFGPVQSTFRNQRASLCLCLLVPWKSFVRCLFETPLPSPPTRRSTKSTKTQSRGYQRRRKWRNWWWGACRWRILWRKRWCWWWWRRKVRTAWIVKSMEAVIFVLRIVVTAARFATACGEIDHDSVVSSIFAQRVTSRALSQVRSHGGHSDAVHPQIFLCPEKFVLNKY